MADTLSLSLALVCGESGHRVSTKVDPIQWREGVRAKGVLILEFGPHIEKLERRK